MSFPRYSAYNDSGIDWMGEVPADWAVAAVAHRYEVVLGKMLDEKQITGDHLAPYLRNVDVQWDRIDTDDLPQMDFAGAHLDRFRLAVGDLLVCEGGEVGRAAIWQGELSECYYQKALHRLRPRSDGADHSRFMFYLLKMAADRGVFAASGGKSTIAHLTAEGLRRHRFAFPSTQVQVDVARFLDHETAKIDALVEEQKRLIELLKEKRQAVISHAVTKGLNPNAPMKDSGVEWLGEVPAHWHVLPLKYFADIGNGSTPNRDRADYWCPTGFPWLSSTVVNQDEVTQADEFVTALALAECHLPRVQPPAILIGITGQGRTRGMATTLMIEATINQHIAYARPRGETIKLGYLRRLFDMAYSKLRADSEAGGSTKAAITCDQIANLRFPLPPAAEQDEVAQAIALEAVKFDALAEDATQAMSLLQERRTALISAAVTGMIDVRRAAAEASV